LLGRLRQPNNAINLTCSAPQKLKFLAREATQVIATPLARKNEWRRLCQIAALHPLQLVTDLKDVLVLEMEFNTAKYRR